MFKISVIVPVYNVEQFLPDCLESLINQIYSNLEIILVDDGSTDGCPQICDAYASIDQRIRVIHKSNEGSAAARNDGLQIATGDLIGFVDSDDLIANDFYKKLVCALVINDADIAVCDFIRFNKTEELASLKNNGIQESVLLPTENALLRLIENEIGSVIWNKIYKRELTVDIIFPPGKYIDDEFWTYRVFGNAKNVVHIFETLYFYRQQPQTIMGQKYSLRRLDGLEAFKERIGYMKKNYPTLEQTAIKTFCFGAMFHYSQILEDQQLDPENVVKRKVFLQFKKYSPWSTVKQWHWKDIIWQQLFLYFPRYYMTFRNLQSVIIKKREKLGL